MEVAHLIVFNLTLLAALVSPGPALLFALRTTLSLGRMAGIVTGLGLGTMAACWTAMALFGLDTIFTLFPWAYVGLRTAGALYLIYIAYCLWKGARQPLSETHEYAPRLHRAFFRGFAINLGNPKSVIFAASVLVVIFPQDLSVSERFIVVVNHLVVEWMAYGLFALLLSTPPARAGYLRLKPILDRAAALILGALGLRLVFTK